MSQAIGGSCPERNDGNGGPVGVDPFRDRAWCCIVGLLDRALRRHYGAHEYSGMTACVTDRIAAFLERDPAPAPTCTGRRSCSRGCGACALRSARPRVVGCREHPALGFRACVQPARPVVPSPAARAAGATAIAQNPDRELLIPAALYIDPSRHGRRRPAIHDFLCARSGRRGCSAFAEHDNGRGEELFFRAFGIRRSPGSVVPARRCRMTVWASGVSIDLIAPRRAANTEPVAPLRVVSSVKRTSADVKGWPSCQRVRARWKV